MADTLTQADIERWLRHFGAVIEQRRAELDELDAATGDGEHGSNLCRGVQSLRFALDSRDFADVQEQLLAAGMAIVNSVGGASGALYGSLFLRLSDVGEGRSALRVDELAEGFASAADGIAELGRSSPGDKTLLDALHPAVVALSGHRATGLADALHRAAVAAEEGRDATAVMLARVGRGSYLGDRSLGHVDAGATSMAQLFRSLYETVVGVGADALP